MINTSSKPIYQKRKFADEICEIIYENLSRWSRRLRRLNSKSAKIREICGKKNQKLTKIS